MRYGYDDGGRLTSITDYDDSVLTYAYDAAGNVTSMTDYHGNTTTYTYTDRNELSTLTAPGSKVWTFHYNDIGQPTYYNIPNGMTTNYGYDSRNRLTTIEHKDGSTVLDGFAYALDDVGNITSTTHEDGSFWDYTYDGRYRLTGAVRKNANETIEAAYAYTYDAGDNLLTKVEPFEDDFNDGNYTGWSVWSGTWSAASNYLRMTPGAAATIARANTDNDNEVRFSYVCNDTSNAGYTLTVSPRYASSGDRIYVNILPGSINLAQRVSGVWSSLDTSATSSTQGVEYTIRVVCDGQNVQVFRTAPGALEELVLETASCTVASTNNLSFTPSANADFSIDNIRVLSDDLSNTTTFAVNNANELTSMTDYNGSTTFGFDAWGRMTAKARGSYAATYAYRYGQMLRSVTSDFPGEGNVTYEYGGIKQRTQLTVNGTTVRFRYDEDIEPLNEENSSGNLTRSFVGGYAEVMGSNPAVGTYAFNHGDHLGSSRRITNSSATTITMNEYTPYGKRFSTQNSEMLWSYAMLADEINSGFMFAPARYYSPNMARWLTRDPMGNLNSYGYAEGSPIVVIDPKGTQGTSAAARFNPLNCDGAYKDLNRDELEDAMSDDPLPEGTSTLLDAGCSGLTAAYIGCESYPEKTPGTKCWLKESKARKRRCGRGKENFVFVKQGQWKHGEPKPNFFTGRVPNDSISSGGGYHNYAICFQDTNTYANMDHGIEEGPQTTFLSPTPPGTNQNYPHEIWCSTCVRR